jgi:hypothetical protein
MNVEKMDHLPETRMNISHVFVLQQKTHDGIRDLNTLFTKNRLGSTGEATSIKVTQLEEMNMLPNEYQSVVSEQVQPEGNYLIINTRHTRKGWSLTLDVYEKDAKKRRSRLFVDTERRVLGIFPPLVRVSYFTEQAKSDPEQKMTEAYPYFEQKPLTLVDQNKHAIFAYQALNWARTQVRRELGVRH